MDYLISFVVSVMTNIAAYIVRKWIDKQSHDKIKSRCTAIQRPFCVATSTMVIADLAFILYHTLTRLDHFH